MLDLSPYMLIYNYGTKTFPLKNLQEIIKFLVKQLTTLYLKHKHKSYHYKISIYLYSIYQK